MMRPLCMALFCLFPLFPAASAQTIEASLAEAEQALTAGDDRAAEAALSRVIQADPHHVKALNMLARLYATATDPEFYDGKTSVELALMALDDSPDNPEIIDTLALGYFAQNKFARAAHECERALALNPYELDYARLMKQVAVTWSARLDMNHPNREVPEKAHAALILGKSHFLLEETDKALAALEKAYRINGPSKEICLYYSKVLHRSGELEKAVEILQSLGEGYTQDPEILAELGRVLRALANFDGAALCLEDAYKQDPGLPGLRKELGALYLEMSKPVQAAIMLKEAFDHLDRGNLFVRDEAAQILYLTARALAGEGALDDAMVCLLDALAMKAVLPEAEALLKVLYERSAGSMKGFRTHMAALTGEDPVLFNEASQAAGLTATGRPAFGDFDQDGDPDLLLGGSRLFANDGRGRFKEVTREKGLSDAGGDAGIFGDYDNDGDLDLYVIVSRLGHREKLYQNTGRLGFKDVSEAAGFPSDVAPTRGAVFNDLNRDGWLDIYLANGAAWNATCKGTFPDTLLLGDGRGGFKNGSRKANLTSGEGICAQGVVFADYDSDGDPDLYVTNARLAPNQLFQNKGDATFVEKALDLGLAGREDMGRFGDSAGAVFGDVDNDCDLDLFVANRAEPRKLLYADQSLLYLNTGQPGFRFSDQTRASGISYGSGHYQPVFGDVNNDGHLDLFLSSLGSEESSRLYLGRGDGTFRDVTWVAGVVVREAEGCALADIDGDGDLDLFVDGGDRPYLYVNEGNKNHWIGFRLQGRRCNGTAIGARVTLDYGTRSQIREISGGRGNACQDEMVARFGLKDHKSTVSVSIQWPDGRSDFYTNLKPDRVHRFEGKK